MKKKAIYLGSYESKKTGKKYVSVVPYGSDGKLELNSIFVSVNKLPDFKPLQECEIVMTDYAYNKPVWGLA